MPLLIACAAAAQPPAFVVGTGSVVAFADYPPSSQQHELARRMMSPLSAAATPVAAESLQSPAIDLTRERFLLYVPRAPSVRGYRLLVFVPPWNAAVLPSGWAQVLEQEHTIFVSATQSGNGVSIFERREPLALIAAANVLHQFPVDSDRIYVGGFSGGSRIALRLALGFPDLFRGVLLNAGSDPIADTQAPLPPAELFRTFQQSTRLVYVTGDEDEINIEQDAGSRVSMLNWCVFDLHTVTMLHTGHGVADASSLRRALDTLTADSPPADPRRLAACRARIERDLSVDMSHLNVLLLNNRLDAVRRLLLHIDTQYGGLAAPQSLELAKRIAAAH